MSNTTEPSKAFEEPVLSDELILEFEQQIKDEEAQKVHRLVQEPLLCSSVFTFLDSSCMPRRAHESTS